MAVVGPTCPQRRLGERVDHGASHRSESDVLAIRRLRPRAPWFTRRTDPERRLMLRAAVARGDILRRIRDLHDPPVAEHRQDLIVESPRPLEVRDRKRDVIQHRYALLSWIGKRNVSQARGKAPGSFCDLIRRRVRARRSASGVYFSRLPLQPQSSKLKLN